MSKFGGHGMDIFSMKENRTTGSRAGRRRSTVTGRPKQAAPQQQGNLNDLFGMMSVQPTPQQQQPAPQQQQQNDLFGMMSVQPTPQQQQPAQQQQQQFDPFAPPAQQQPQAAPVANPFPQPQLSADRLAQPRANPFAQPQQQQSFDPFAAPAPQQPQQSFDPFAAPAPQQQQQSFDPFAAPAPKQQATPKQQSQAQEDSSSSSSSSDSSDSSDDEEESKREEAEMKAKAQKNKRTKLGALSEDGKAVAATGKEAGPKSKARPLMTIDLLRAMKMGTPFLKYGSSGFPHFRHFRLSADNCSVVWFSKKKSAHQTQVYLDDIHDFCTGQTTQNFKLHPSPELASSSFSIIYGPKRSTLDLIAKDPNDLKVWTQGLPKLVDMAKNGELGEDTKEVLMQLPIQSGRRSSVSLIDFKSKKTADEIAGDDVEPKKFRGNPEPKKVFKKLQKLKKELVAYRKKAVKCSQHEQYPTIENILNRVAASLSHVGEWYNMHDYAHCDDELWQCEVDFEGLEQMIAVVAKSSKKR